MLEQRAVALIVAINHSLSGLASEAASVDGVDDIFSIRSDLYIEKGRNATGR
jgi:hypothetical protein